MDNRLNAFISLAELFENHGYKLYLVGGTVRDYLLGLPLSDMDAVTDATPIDVIKFLPDADTTFAHLGSLKYKDNSGVKFDITTLREESGYLDSRHPSKVNFVKDPKDDYKRRDFTVNAMYMDKDLKIYDYCDGQKDLENRILRMVGNPDQRLKEDPLRIIRCLRFSLTYNLTIEQKLEKALMSSIKYLDMLSKDKIVMEMKKIIDVDREKMNELFDKYSIKHLLDVIE